MNRNVFRLGVFMVLVLAVLFGMFGCKKRTPTLPPPPPPTTELETPAPTIQLRANPEIVNYGESSTLSWASTDATEVVLKNIGKFTPEGSTVVTPTESTTYTAIAYGPGGMTRSQVRVTVVQKTETITPTTVPPVDEQALSDEEIFRTQIKDVFFDFDKYNLTPEADTTLRQNAEILRTKIPDVRIIIEGHCDERGTSEYNLALGDKRANSVRDFLVAQGIAASRIRTISYGEERPFDPGHNEEAWAKNRRGHFVLMK
ncbi:MAG: peptidoglycan-associated lipoprotein Pal [Acidobacteria bacterium]|nr:peptidoglycan-associated lipoprotein Pal [Acidobacteriota bacterium]